MTQSSEDMCRKALIEAKFLRREGLGILPQRLWNAAADLEIVLASTASTIVEHACTWLRGVRGQQ